jgi:hypothetical protein
MKSDEKRAVPKEDETIAQTGATGNRDADLTPSWFAANHAPGHTEALASQYRSARADDPLMHEPAPEAYEAYRRRLEERFQSAKRMAHEPVQTLSTMDHNAPPPRRPRGDDDDGNLRFREWQRKVQNRTAKQVERRNTGRLSPARIAGLFAGACAIGGIAGFGSANVATIEPMLTSSQAVLAAGVAKFADYMPTWGETAPPSPGPATVAATVLTKKPVKMARVTVNDAMGSLNNPIALDLAAFPATDEVPLALKITGLPDDAYLTQGREIAAGEWLLKQTEIEGVKLVVPQTDNPQLDLAVAGVEEKSGTQATPPQEMTIELDLSAVQVLPANAPPEVQSAGASRSLQLPAAIPLPQEVQNTEAQTVLAKADTLFKTGDIVSARQFYMKAHGLGLMDAAYGVGQSYDPTVYAEMNVFGLSPDPAMALQWYEKAANAGHLEAARAVERLKAAPRP